MAMSSARAEPRPHSGAPPRIVDPKFRHHAARYVTQCLAATLTVFVVLSALDAFRQTVLVAALGASAFIAFTMPGVNASRPRYLLGGYLVGIVVGCSVSLVALEVLALAPEAMRHPLTIAFAALAVGIAIFVMVVTDTEHPPAAGLALGFVLNDWDLPTAAAVFMGIVAISLVKESFRRRMMDLL